MRCVRLFVRRPVALAQWSAANISYGAWAFRGLKGESADWALVQGLVQRTPPNGPLRRGGRLELFETAALGTQPDAGRVDAVAYCLGVRSAPLPLFLVAQGHGVERLEPTGHLRGSLLDCRGEPIPRVHGVGMAFADPEYSSGAAYAEAGFGPFALRAAEVAAQIAAELSTNGDRKTELV